MFASALFALVTGLSTILDQTPAGPERRSAIEALMRDVVPMGTGGLVLIAIFGFGVGVYRSSDGGLHLGTLWSRGKKGRRKPVPPRWSARDEDAPRR
jgi:hypothetical protein